MTEINVKAAKPRYAVDIVPFALALFAAPFWVALLGFWALLIPVFAIPVGGLAYLVVGTPALLIHLHYRVGTPESTAQLAFSVIATCTAALLLLVLIFGDADAIGPALGLGIVASIMDILWGLAFGCLYNRWRSDQSRQPIPLA